MIADFRIDSAQVLGSGRASAMLPAACSAATRLGIRLVCPLFLAVAFRSRLTASAGLPEDTSESASF